MHSNKEAHAIKAADIVRDPSDLPAPIGERAPAVVKVTLTSPPEGPVGGVVTMGSMTFSPANITINAGEQVVWKNTSTYYHNVVDDPGRALSRLDVSMPSGASAFGSALLQPGATFYHTFGKPGTYRYVCTVHETGGMKATVIVKPAPMLASK
jgi:plastocyanin